MRWGVAWRVKEWGFELDEWFFCRHPLVLHSLETVHQFLWVFQPQHLFCKNTETRLLKEKENSIGLEVKTKYQPLTLKKLIVLYESVPCDYRSGSKIVLLKIVMIVKGNLRFFICWDVR